MNPISQDFAPPFRLIAPFFIIGGVFYLLTTFFLFSFHGDDFSYVNPKVIAFVHMFLLGFIMMTIFGAMAQLVPVVLEVGHAAVELFYAIWPLLLIGTSLMIFGFLYSAALLPYGGVVVLIAMMIFVMETFFTIAKVKKLNLAMTSVLISNTFLFFGIIVGLLMALTYAGTISLDLHTLLRSHLYLVVAGYIMITIMGLSSVLLPMFTLSHDFSWRPLEIAMSLMTIGVVLVVASSVFDMDILAYIGYFFSFASIPFYSYLVYIIFKTRPRKENDVYALSMFFSYASLIISFIIGIIYFLTKNEALLMGASWLLIFGFFGFLITGHIYKIIPFLVWFERFSPLVGKQKVPMLADMVPYKSSQAQMIFCAVGVVLITIAIIFKVDMFIGAGASFLVIGAFAFLRSMLYMINFK